MNSLIIFCKNDNSVQKPVLQFAGEHTSTEHFQTVHGAYESGKREALRIVSYYDDTANKSAKSYENQLIIKLVFDVFPLRVIPTTVI